MLEDAGGGQEAVVVTGDGKRVASLYEPEEHREENDRIIRSLLDSGKDKGRQKVSADIPGTSRKCDDTNPVMDFFK